jgi:homoserine kinase
MRVTVRVPATVANLGPGFDCLALAVDWMNEFTADTKAPAGVSVEGEGAEDVPRDGTNLVWRAAGRFAAEVGRPLPAFALTCRNRIPLQRGLGSSASAVVAGLLLADRLLGTEVERDRLLQMALGLEGHPDNVAACLHGGIVLVFSSEGRWCVEPLRPHPSLRPVLLVPTDERMPTPRARGAVPEEVPLVDAAFNAARTALAVLALTERIELLPAAVQDRLHQPYRLPLMPRAAALFEELRRAGLPVSVAGSGPSLLVLEDGGATAPDPGPGWRLLRTRIAPQGAVASQG